MCVTTQHMHITSNSVLPPLVTLTPMLTSVLTPYLKSAIDCFRFSYRLRTCFEHRNGYSVNPWTVGHMLNYIDVSVNPWTVGHMLNYLDVSVNPWTVRHMLNYLDNKAIFHSSSSPLNILDIKLKRELFSTFLDHKISKCKYVNSFTPFHIKPSHGLIQMGIFQ